jgi:opacity protein-like surface antigen
MSNRTGMRIFPIVMVLAIGSAKADAQFNLQNFHLNIFAGVANYHGDLQDKWFTFSQSKFAVGLGASYDISDHISVRGSLVYAHLSADDKFGNNRVRNLNFSTKLYEANAGVEYYITRMEDHLLTPYVFGGIAFYHFNPYTYDTSGNKYFIKFLNTEGEGFTPGRPGYKLTQFGIPFGAGVKFSLSENINIGIEVGYRKLFTDYLDDVSTTYVDENTLLAKMGPKAVELAYRGNELKDGAPYPPGGTARGSKGDDSYYFAGFTASFRIFRKNADTRNTSRHPSYECPKNVQ